MTSDRLLKAMNDQIKNELESYYIYLSMASYFHDLSLDGMAHWMRCQAHEEMVHAMKFFDHILDRGGKVVLEDLAQSKKKRLPAKLLPKWRWSVATNRPF